MHINLLTRKMPCHVCKHIDDCTILDALTPVMKGLTSSVEDLTFKCLARKRYRCEDCENLGESVRCSECAGGSGWNCKADLKGQHVNPGMGACGDFVKKEESDGT